MDHRVCLGFRVVRGPDWEWGDQDGGEGHVGTVVDVELVHKAVVVQWDCGSRCRYRCGHDDKYDLRVLDSGPTGLRHYNMICNWCDEQPTGILWKCAQCYDYVLCSQCYNAGKHTLEHCFNRCDRLDQRLRTRVKARHYSRKVPAMGTFRGAKVTRGADWQWGNQDGGLGNTGQVTKVEGWERQSFRSVVEVVWNGLSSKNVYRIGHAGKVDLKCISPSSGGLYYPEHLEALGAPYIRPSPSELSAGDAVRVELDPDLFKIAQEDHGGWNDLMAEFIGRVGVVNTVQDCGDVVVRYSNNKIFLLNQYALTKVDIPVFGYGDVVRILDDLAKVHNLQPGHGEWNDDMALSLGQVGRVVKVQANSDVRVAVNGRRWIMNPRCMVPAPNQTPQEDFLEEVQIDRATKLHIVSLSQADVPDVVATAAAAGDSSTIFSYLSRHPEEVNTKLEGASPLHLAIVEGFTSVLKTIIHFKPDLNIDGDSGEKPLHICAYTNNGAAAKLLIDAGANVNAKDASGNTPLSLAAALGHCNAVKALLDCPDTDINSQNFEGKTPLHSAIFCQQRRTTHMLLEGGANPTFLDFSLTTPYHNSAGFGFLAGLEEFLRFYPEHVNIPKDDGYTPLHVATANNHADLVSLIASSPKCDINARAKTRLTALHIAVHEGHVKLVERLVGFGADLEMTTEDGNTALHIALGRNNMTPPTEDSPKIRAVQSEVETIHGMNVVPTNVIVGMFLVSQGADTYAKNLKGVSPLQLRPADISELILLYRGRGDRYHGSLKVACNPFTEPPRRARYRPVRHPRSAPLASVAAAAVGDAANFANPDVSQSLPVRMEKLGLHDSESKGGQLMRENLETVNDDATAIVGTKMNTKLRQNRDNNQKPMDAAAILSRSPTKELPKPSQCALCEKAADIQLHPCGHIALCHPCRDSVKAIKRCPQVECRSPVTSFTPVCVQCQKVKQLTAHIPCEHRYCLDCGAGLDHCKACRAFTEQ